MNDNNNEIKELESNGEVSSFTIYEFFSEHTTILITLISAFIASLVVIITASLYIREAVCLRYWNISDSLIDISNRSRLYGGGIAFAASILMSILSIYTFHTFLSFNSYLPHNTKKKKRLKSLNKIVVEKDDQYIADYKEIKKEIRKISIISIGVLVKNYALPSIIIGGIMLTLYQTAFTKFLDIVLIAFIILALPFLLNGVQSILFYIKAYKNADVSLDRKLSDIKPYPLEQIHNISIRNMFSNKAIKTQLLAVLLMVIVSFITFSSSNYLNVKSQKVFPIIKNNKQYAIVYQNANYAVLEEATIANKTLFINTTKQKIVSVNELEYELITFDMVQKK